MKKKKILTAKQRLEIMSAIKRKCIGSFRPRKFKFTIGFFYEDSFTPYVTIESENELQNMNDVRLFLLRLAMHYHKELEYLSLRSTGLYDYDYLAIVLGEIRSFGFDIVCTHSEHCTTFDLNPIYRLINKI